jgi:hypothetical protein
MSLVGQCPICGARHATCGGPALLTDPALGSNWGKRMDGAKFTSDRRLYTDKDGNVVEADDPAKLTLLVGEGGAIPMERARELGLADEEGNAVAREAEDEAETDPETGETKPRARKAAKGKRK